MAAGFSLVITTTASQDSARAIAARLLEDSLAACVQIFPVESHYVWQGETVQENEYALHIKTRSDLFDAVRQTITGMHAYDVPEIVRLDIGAGHDPYLRWITQVTRP